MLVFNKYFLRLVQTGALLFALILVCAGVPASAEDADGASTRKMTERQIGKLCEPYITAIEEKNFEDWYELLSPRHSTAPELNEEYFLEQVQDVKSLSIQKIDGFNVQLRIRYASGERGTGSLQIDPTGQIKYTPFCFKHPLYEVCAQLELLLSDQDTIMGATSSPASRAAAAYTLKSMDIPLFDYDPYASSRHERLMIAQKILGWLKENGPEYDTTEPKSFLPPDDFNTLIDRLHRAAR